MGREPVREKEALAVSPGGEASSRIDWATGAGLTKREQESHHCQTAIRIGVDHVKLSGEALAVHEVLRRRVKVRRFSA